MIRRKRQVARLVAGYREGRRLMRQGDGADEWAGMRIARDNLMGLVELGRNEYGEKASVTDLVEVLRVHGLHDEAESLQVSRG